MLTFRERKNFNEIYAVRRKFLVRAVVLWKRGGGVKDFSFHCCKILSLKQNSITIVCVWMFVEGEGRSLERTRSITFAMVKVRIELNPDKWIRSNALR